MSELFLQFFSISVCICNKISASYHANNSANTRSRYDGKQSTQEDLVFPHFVHIFICFFFHDQLVHNGSVFELCSDSYSYNFLFWYNCTRCCSCFIRATSNDDINCAFSTVIQHKWLNLLNFSAKLDQIVLSISFKKLLNLPFYFFCYTWSDYKCLDIDRLECQTVRLVCIQELLARLYAAYNVQWK